MAEKKNLFVDFPPISTEEWKERITADLKGADFEKRLVWKTNEGFNVSPFYREEDILHYQSLNSTPSVFPFIRGTKNDNQWFVRQDLVVTDPVEANKKVINLLEKGVDSLCFIVTDKIIDKEFIIALLHKIPAETVEINFKICINQVV